MAYILRLAIRETHWKAQLADLLSLCSSAGIEEVMLMEQSHQILMVPFTLEKHRRMAEIYREFERELRKRGVEFSINIATIVGHSDAPVPISMVLPFQKFVGEDLVERHSVYCIGDPQWRRYAQDVVGLYAQLRPKRIMIDDDFRSLNHTTNYGCFCPIHTRLTAERLSTTLTPEALKRGITDPSEEGLLMRQAWQEVNFELQLQAAKAIEEAIHRVNPEIQVGLMNSGEPAHSVQGRDMNRLLSAFAGKGRIRLSRPAGGAYADGLHGALVDMHQISALSMEAAGPEPTHWISEVENYPHSRFIKSLRITRLQMLIHTLWGADDLSLNLYDYLATPFKLEQPITDLLIQTRKDIQTLKEARQGMVLTGVALPWRANASALRTGVAGQLDSIMPSRPMDTILPLLGIPTQFQDGPVRVILGSDIKAYSDQELRVFLAGGLVLDNLAAEYLASRGMDDLVGCSPAGIVKEPTVERLVEEEFCGPYTQCDLPTNWFRLPQEGKKISRFKLKNGALEVSVLLDMDDHYLAPGVIRFSNALGGKVVVLPQEVHDLGWLHRGRSIMMYYLFRWLLGDRLMPLLYDSPNCSPFYYVHPHTGQELLALLNTGLDDQVLKWTEGEKECFPVGWKDLYTGESINVWPELKGLELKILVRQRREEKEGI